MPAAIMQALAVVAFLGGYIWLARQVARWHANWVWSRYRKQARAHHRSGRFLDDYRPPLSREAVDAEFEDVREGR